MNSSITFVYPFENKKHPLKSKFKRHGTDKKKRYNEIFIKLFVM